MKHTKVVEKKLGRNKVGKYPIVGLAHFDTNHIEIDPRQGSKDFFGTLIHEQLHLIFPYLNEDEILRAEKKLCNLLWKQNYRKVSM